MGFLLFGIEAFYRLGVSARPSHKEFCLLLFWQLRSSPNPCGGRIF
jgi:hypothetical protein